MKRREEKSRTEEGSEEQRKGVKRSKTGTSENMNNNKSIAFVVN